MEPLKIIALKKTILEDNDQDAQKLREETQGQRLSYINVMSSPGAGKTTTILALLGQLQRDFRCGVMEADIDSDVDAQAIRQAGYPSVQLHTGGMCHLDAQMSRQGLAALGTSGLDLVFLENVGNLVCPAEFDTGADLNLVILSVPEGDDKPLKYPLIFSKADAVLVNKMDALPAFDFSLERCRENIRLRAPELPVFPVSAKTGAGIPEAAAFIAAHVKGRN
ncbi:MAG: hydrogenase nickel incorporation protein HypB [Lachnospiraceae bacterium]